MKRCRRCQKEKPLSEFYKRTGSRDGLQSNCKRCGCESAIESHNANAEQFRERNRKWKADHCGRRLLHGVKARAKQRKIPYTLTPEDESALATRVDTGCCELTGVAFTFGNGLTWDSPSIDRIDSSLGYEPGNVRVVIHGLNAAMGNWGLDITIEFVEAAKRKLEKRT